VTVFHPNKYSSQDGFLQGFIKLEVKLLQLLADEADSQNRHFFYDKVLIAHVVSDFLGDAFPFLSRYFDAANRCDDLHEEYDTLAAALRMSLSLSIMVLMTMSLIDDLAAGLKRSQKRVSSAGLVG
jgi:hypothetical protein